MELTKLQIEDFIVEFKSKLNSNIKLSSEDVEEMSRQIEQYGSDNLKILDLLKDYVDINNEENKIKLFDGLSELQSKEFINNEQVIKELESVECHVTTFLQNKYNVNDVKEIFSLSEYVDFCTNLEPQYVSRGQKYYDYDFIPSSFRLLNNESDFFNMSKIEDMFVLFKQKLFHYFPEFRKKTSMEILSFAQHYGLPTNLLDFTDSHLISILFAVEDYKDTSKDAVVIFVDPTVSNEKSISLKGMLDCSDDNNKKRIETILETQFAFIKSDDIHKRIHAQQGCFLNFPTKKCEKDAIEFINESCKIAVIRKEAKNSILQSLFNIGLNFENIYPDLDNAVKSIIFKNKKGIE